MESLNCRFESGGGTGAAMLTKKLRDHCVLSYEERLICTRLITLKKKRCRADLVIAFKALNGAIVVESRGISVELLGVPARSYRTNLLVHRAINNSVKSSFKYRAGKS